MNRRHLSLAGHKPEIAPGARNPEADGAGEFHGYLVGEGRESYGVEGFGCVEIGDVEAGVCDGHVEVVYRLEYILFEV